MFFLFLTLLLAQEAAVLYCAYRLVFDLSCKFASAPHSVTAMPVPEFAKVKVPPPSLSVITKPTAPCHRGSHGSHRQKLVIESSMSMVAGA
jgi:hypothetical protein